MRLDREAERGQRPQYTSFRGLHLIYSVGNGESLRASKQGEPCFKDSSLLQCG